MNAKELHEHVSKWPVAALPKGVGVTANDNPMIVEPTVWMTYISIDHAIALHVASGLEWLNVEGQSVDFRKDGDGVWLGIALSYASKHLVYRGPTLFEAIHAAILATQENA